MDNRVFNINGRTKEQLKKAVDLLLFDEYNEYQKVKGWYYHKKKGFILTWYVGDSQEKAIPFTNRLGVPEPIEREELVEVLWEWLDSEDAKNVEHGDSWDHNMSHDGSNELGWRLYTEEWGHVRNPDGHTIDHYSIAAFKPAYLWYGK